MKAKLCEQEVYLLLLSNATV